MAVVDAVVELSQFGTVAITWANMANSDTGSSVDLARFTDKTVQVTGTFSTGGEVTMQGGNDDSTWGTLTDAAGADLAITTTKPRLLVENPQYIRPNVTGGDGSTDVTVIVVCAVRGK